MSHCGRCNRVLKTPKSVEVGFGPTCYKKHLQAINDAEFERNQITIDEVEVYGQDRHTLQESRRPGA